jgi:hypothetical protein
LSDVTFALSSSSSSLWAIAAASRYALIAFQPVAGNKMSWGYTDIGTPSTAAPGWTILGWALSLDTGEPPAYRCTAPRGWHVCLPARRRAGPGQPFAGGAQHALACLLARQAAPTLRALLSPTRPSCLAT